MTLENIDGALWIPWLPAFIGNVPYFNFVTVDAGAEKAAIILRAPQDGTLDQFEWCSLNSDVSNGSDLRYSFQDLDSTGLPNGTATYYRIVSPTFSSTDWQETGILSDDGTDIGVKKAVSRGDMLACVIEWDTFNSPDILRIGFASGIGATSNDVLFYSSGTWAAADADGSIPSAALKYDDGSYPYIPGCFPSLDTTGDELPETQHEWGMAISFPAPVLVGGVKMFYGTGADTTNAKVTLYDKDFYTILEQVDLKPSLNNRYQHFLFSQEYLFAANEVYRIVVSFTDGTVGDGGLFFKYRFDNQNLLGVGGNAPLRYLTYRYGADVSLETWIDDTLSRPFISLMVTGIDHQTGGGG